MIWRWKAWGYAKRFGIYCFSQFLTVLSQFWKWLKTYFLRNFYKLYRNWANNIPLKSYEKCETILYWWFSLITSLFQVILKTTRSFILPLSRNRFFRNAPRGELELLGMSTWTSLCFSRPFFARSSPSTHRNTHRNWASNIPVVSWCKHATFPCWSFFHTRDYFKSFSWEIHSL